MKDCTTLSPSEANNREKEKRISDILNLAFRWNSFVTVYTYLPWTSPCIGCKDCGSLLNLSGITIQISRSPATKISAEKDEPLVCFRNCSYTVFLLWVGESFLNCWLWPFLGESLQTNRAPVYLCWAICWLVCGAEILRHDKTLAPCNLEGSQLPLPWHNIKTKIKISIRI